MILKDCNLFCALQGKKAAPIKEQDDTLFVQNQVETKCDRSNDSIVQFGDKRMGNKPRNRNKMSNSTSTPFLPSQSHALSKASGMRGRSLSAKHEHIPAIPAPEVYHGSQNAKELMPDSYYGAQLSEWQDTDLSPISRKELPGIMNDLRLSPTGFMLNEESDGLITVTTGVGRTHGLYGDKQAKLVSIHGPKEFKNAKIKLPARSRLGRDLSQAEELSLVVKNHKS